LHGEAVKFGIPLNLEIAFSLVITVFGFVVAYLAGRKATSGVPSGAQNLGEVVVEFLADQIEPEVGSELLPSVLSWLGAIFIYILIANWIGLIPFCRQPTSDLSTTAGLAITAVIGVQVLNVKVNGLKGAAKQWLKPVWWFFILFIPIKILDNFARFLSLALRLFGNIGGEHLVFEQLFNKVPYLLPVILLLLGLLVGLIQAIVFTLLNLFYIVEDLGTGDED